MEVCLINVSPVNCDKVGLDRQSWFAKGSEGHLPLYCIWACVVNFFVSNTGIDQCQSVNKLLF